MPPQGQSCAEGETCVAVRHTGTTAAKWLAWCPLCPDSMTAVGQCAFPFRGSTADVVLIWSQFGQKPSVDSLCRFPGTGHVPRLGVSAHVRREAPYERVECDFAAWTVTQVLMHRDPSVEFQLEFEGQDVHEIGVVLGQRDLADADAAPSTNEPELTHVAVGAY